MKQAIIILTFALFCLTNLKAQTTFSCTYTQFCYWNETTEKYSNCEGFVESSLFVMNKAETMFTHTTEALKSTETYYVESKEYDKELDVYKYFVTRDTGYKYYYIFDPKNKRVTATNISAASSNEKNLVFAIYTVESIF